MLFALKGFESCTVVASSVRRPSNQIRKNLKNTFREKEETGRRVLDEGSPLWGRQACRRRHIYTWINISNIGYMFIIITLLMWTNHQKVQGVRWFSARWLKRLPPVDILNAGKYCMPYLQSVPLTWLR